MSDERGIGDRDPAPFCGVPQAPGSMTAKLNNLLELLMGLGFVGMALIYVLAAIANHYR